MSRMNQVLGRLVNGALRYAGLEIRAVRPRGLGEFGTFRDVEPWVAHIIAKIRPFTMTSDERISALCHAVRYISKLKIPGDIVECGVWRGGSIMATALTLLGMGDTSRILHLFDTFAGMPPPAEVDRAAATKMQASLLLNQADRSSDIWAVS